MPVTGNQQKPTRFKGPAIITLRGAGSQGGEMKFGGVASPGAGADIGLRIQVPSAQAANILTFEKPDSTVLGGIDSAGNVFGSAGVAATGMQVAQVTLTAANIIAMNATPVQILAAPGAGKVIVVDKIFFQMKPTATQFTSGGVVTVVYDGTAVNPTTGSIAAANINSASAKYFLFPPYVAASLDLSTVANLGLKITNATAAFATGTGTAIVTIWYQTITLG